ncbi:MAG: hypothetical protein Q8S18_07815 [Bacteroidales bacterium]|nr:hypothetical protein [Bacteroidales bacterium]
MSVLQRMLIFFFPQIQYTVDRATSIRYSVGFGVKKKRNLTPMHYNFTQ